MTTYTHWDHQENWIKLNTNNSLVLCAPRAAVDGILTDRARIELHVGYGVWRSSLWSLDSGGGQSRQKAHAARRLKRYRANREREKRYKSDEKMFNFGVVLFCKQIIIDVDGIVVLKNEKTSN